MSSVKILIPLVLLSLLAVHCSSTQIITSEFNQAPASSSANLAALAETTSRHTAEGLDYFVTHDDEFLYVHVQFTDPVRFRNAMDFGFSLFVHETGDTRRSFGISYPTGIYFELGGYAGARNSFVFDTEWGSKPENQPAWRAANNNTVLRALVLTRTSRREEIQQRPMLLNQLREQQLRLHSDFEGTARNISFTVPLSRTPQSTFSPDIGSQSRILVGLEINPVEVLGLEFGTPPGFMGSEAEIRRQRRTDDTMARETEMITTRLGGSPFSHWFEVERTQP